MLSLKIKEEEGREVGRGGEGKRERKGEGEEEEEEEGGKWKETEGPAKNSTGCCAVKPGSRLIGWRRGWEWF